MSWWNEQDDQRRTAIRAVLDTDRGRDCRAYAGDDQGFAAWLLVADVTCRHRHGVSIFDLADWTWRDAYDAGTKPAAALREALHSDGLVGGGV